MVCRWLGLDIAALLVVRKIYKNWRVDICWRVPTLDNKKTQLFLNWYLGSCCFVERNWGCGHVSGAHLKTNTFFVKGCLVSHESCTPEKNYLYRREGKGRRYCLGAEFIQFQAALQIYTYHHYDFKKWMNRKILIHTTPNHNHSKRDVLPKTFLQIILSAKWLYIIAAFQYVPQTAATTFAFSSV